jgi:hypothetical protein
MGNSGVQYPEAFAAIGRLIVQKGLRDVCVLEFEHGLIVTGSVLFEAGENYQRRIETHVLSNEDLNRMIKGR